MWITDKLNQLRTRRKWKNKSNQELLDNYLEACWWVRVRQEIGTASSSCTVVLKAEEGRELLDKYIIPEMKSRGFL